MEYIFDRRKRKWYNSEALEYVTSFDVNSNKRRLKIRRNPYYGYFGSSYAYRDIVDIKLIFNNGTLFGVCKSSSCSSSFMIPKENIVNTDIIINIKEDFKYLADYISMVRECNSRAGVTAQQYMFRDPNEKDAERVRIDTDIKNKLTEEQRLYIELNKISLGLDDF